MNQNSGIYVMSARSQLSICLKELQSETGRLGAEVKKAASSSETTIVDCTAFLSVIHSDLTFRMIDGGWTLS